MKFTSTLVLFFTLFFSSVRAQPVCTADLPKNSKCVIDIRNLHPTQPEVGAYQVKLKVEELKKLSPSEVDDLAKKKEVPCIIGPDRQFYLIDHHHQSLAFLLNGNLKAYVNVIENWSRIQPEQFWPLMCSKNFCFSSLADGTTIDPRDSRFPHALNQCGDNPYRSLVWLLIKSKLIKEGTVPYFEFKVGEILYRHGLKIEGHPMHQNEWSSYLDESAHLLKKDSVQREIQAI